VIDGVDAPSRVAPVGRRPSTWQVVGARVVFAVGTALLTLAGTAFVGDLRLSWWVSLLPLMLLIGPLTSAARVRRRTVP